MNNDLYGDSNRVIIPKNLEECFLALNKQLAEEDIEVLKSIASKEDLISYHHGLGEWIRNTWFLWVGSVLNRYFEERGVDHPDDISDRIIRYYHDWLNGNHEEWRGFDQNMRP